MPIIQVALFQEEDGSVPLLNWLDQLPQKARAKCVVRIERLRAMGHELRRPEADLLRDDIWELRAKWGSIQYRMLYFFHGRGSAVVSHGFVKPGAKVDPREIDSAIERMMRFKRNPTRYTYREEASS